MRCLGRGPEGHVACRADLCEHAARLHGVGYQPRLDIAARDDDVGRGDRRLDVVRLELPDVALVRAELLVHERRAGCERLLEVGNGRQRLVVDLDELGSVLREGAALGDDDGDGVTLVPRLVDCDGPVRRCLDVLRDRPCARQSARPVLREVCAREGGDHAFGGTGGIQAHALDAGTRVRVADHGQVDHSRQREVVDERSASTQERRVLLALDGGADDALAGLGGGHDATPAADATAWTMLWYPVQRQRLPSRPSRIDASSVTAPLSMRLTTASTIPGVQ